jgi:hypothetical protein
MNVRKCGVFFNCEFDYLVKLYKEKIIKILMSKIWLKHMFSKWKDYFIFSKVVFKYL